MTLARAAALRVALLVVLAAVTSACNGFHATRDGAKPDVWSERGMLSEGVRFLDDRTFRRTALVESLTNPKNTYSRERLTSYGLGMGGWDLLPEWNPRSVVLSRSTAQAIQSGKPPFVATDTPPLWDGVRPSSMAAWVALGREVFFRYPLRREVFVHWALAHPGVGARVGVRPADDGSYPGVVAFVDTRGESQIGMTCAMCHADVENGRVIIGQARRAFDFGALRLAYHADTGTFVEADLARRMRTWGPGRADVTEDDDEDPVAIPDLWGLRYQTFLTQAGTIKHTGVAALAIRQETQLLTSNLHVIRPPRELALALAFFLYSLTPPPAVGPADSVVMARGKAIFLRHCEGCHSNAVGGGELVPAAEVDTDRALANGAARGTGHYRPPALVRVAKAAPYFHQGAVSTLEDVLSAARLEPTYANGFLGPGPVAGHLYGTDLPQVDRDALVTYLRAL
jgi:cytochrome c5